MAYISEGIWALIPKNGSCASGHAIDSSKASQEGAEGFFNRWSDFVQSLLVDSTAGIVLGSISAAGFAVFCLWLCVYLRRRRIIARARRDKRDQRAEAKQAQFLAADEYGPVAAKGAAPQRWWQVWWQRLTAGRVLKWGVVVLAAAVVGVGIWGMVESISATNDLISDFWLLVDSVEALALDLAASVGQLGRRLADVAGTLRDIQPVLQKVVDTVNGIPVVGGLIGKALPMDKVNTFLGPTADSAIAGLDDASAVVLDEIYPVLNDTVLPAIQRLRDNNEGWSVDVQEKWRYVVFAVLFGLLILLAALVAAACFRMRWGLTATLLVALLWATNAVVMFVGMGMLNGLKGVATDACLYAEETVIRVANESVTGSAREPVEGALRYYLGMDDLVDSKGNPLLTNGTSECNPELSAALLRQVAGIDVASGLVLAWSIAGELPSISGALNSLKLPTIPLVNFNLNTLTQPVADAAENLQGLLDDVCNTTLLLVRENRVWPIYVAAKTFVCCDLTNSLYNVWVAWVVAGSLTFALCLLASLRVVTATLRPTGRSDYSSHDGAAAKAAAADGGGGAAATNTEPA